MTQPPAPGPMSHTLDGRHVVIVGGSGGIGRATAAAVLALGGRVTILSRNEDKLRRAASDLGQGDRVAWKVLDVMEDAAVTRYFGSVADASVDHLVITASSVVHGPFTGPPTGHLRGMFEVKFWGPVKVARGCLPKLVDGGSITFFSGVLSRRPGINCSMLGAVNAAVEGLTRSLALELGPRLRVNCCSPGMVRTDAYAGMPEEQREAMYRATGESLPVGRVGFDYEVADAVLFLMTNTYATGLVLDVDGGHMIRQYATR